MIDIFDLEREKVGSVFVFLPAGNYVRYEKPFDVLQVMNYGTCLSLKKQLSASVAIAVLL